MSKNLKIGLFGGSFNPISKAHLKICEILLKKNLINKFLFIPCSYRSEKFLFETTENRLKMLKLGINQYFKIKTPTINSLQKKNFQNYKEKILIDEIEIKSSSKMIPTSILLKKYEKLYPNINFSFIIGSDLLEQLPLWENFENDLRNHNFFVFKRNFIDDKIVKDFLPKSFVIDNFPDKETSSTRIRKLVYEDWYGETELRKRLEVYTMPDVVDYIIRNNLYDH